MAKKLKNNINNKPFKLLAYFVFNFVYLFVMFIQIQNRDLTNSLESLKNINLDLEKIDFPYSISISFIFFALLIGFSITAIQSVNLLKINIYYNFQNKLKIVIYSFSLYTGILFTFLYIFRFYNLSRGILLISTLMYPLLFYLFSLFINLSKSQLIKKFKHKKILQNSLFLCAIVAGLLIFQLNRENALSIETVDTKNTQGQLNVSFKPNYDNVDCYKWSGSNNFVDCIIGSQISLEETISYDVVNSIVYHQKNRYIVLQKGKILDKNKSIFLDISNRVYGEVQESGLYDIAFHPSEKYFLVSYSNVQNQLTVEKFTYDKDKIIINSEIVLRIPNPSKYHYCGTLKWSSFYKDFLLCVGDMGQSIDALSTTSQKGKIIFLNSKNNFSPDLLSESENENILNNILAYGLRNPWKFTQIDDLLIIPDVGGKINEELNVVNLNVLQDKREPYLFGWPLFEGSVENIELESINGLINWSDKNILIKDYISSNTIEPSVFYNRPAPENNRAAIIGATVYKNIDSFFNNHIIFADYLSKELFAYNYSKNQLYILPLPQIPGVITSVNNNPEDLNSVLITTKDSDTSSSIYKLEFPNY